VRIVETCGVLRLGAEAGTEGPVAGELAVQHLDRHGAFEQRVAGAPDPAHPAAGERDEELVPVGEQAASRFHVSSPCHSPVGGPDPSRLPGVALPNPGDTMRGPFG
jgi:hypothetical protein